MSKKEFYKTIFSFFGNHKFQFSFYIILGFISIVFGLFEPLFSAKLLQGITSVAFSDILLFSAILLVLGLLEQLFSFFRNEQEITFRQIITLDTQAFVSKALFSLEQKNFDEKGTSFFTTRVQQDSGTTARILSRLNHGLSYSLKSFGVLIYIFMMSIPMGIYFMVSSVLLFLVRIISIKKREKQRKEEDEKQEAYSSSFSEIIRGIRDIKVLNLKETMIQKTLSDQKKINQMNQRNRKKMFVYDELEWFLRKFFDFGVLAFAIYLIYKNAFLGTNLIILYTYKGQAFQFLNSLFYLYEDITNFKYSFGRLYELMDEKTYSKEIFGTKHIAKLKGEIEFRSVSFGYNEAEVLKQVSFHIKPNNTVGFVGKSGAGKSTIFQLISRLYQKNTGDILFDGVSIDTLDERSIRDNISVITQNPYLFNMTIRENLKIVNPNATEEEMIKNCKLCAFHDYVSSLPNGYDTLIGEGGVILSGGLRQRLAIARALMKKSEIILLDEATSALDNETQDFIKNSIYKISDSHTILIIAHRLSTIKDCDYIIVVDDGKIVGVGTHEELIKKNTCYQNLYQHELI